MKGRRWEAFAVCRPDARVDPPGQPGIGKALMLATGPAPGAALAWRERPLRALLLLLRRDNTPSG